MKSRSKVALLYIGLFLQSCSSVVSNTNINPITRENLLKGGLLTRPRGVSLADEDQPLIEELRSKLGRLRNEGFVDGIDPNNTDMRKHLMFVFYHWLRCKQSRMTFQERVTHFNGLNDTRNLVWNLVYDRREDIVEFRLRNIYNQRTDPDWRRNLDRSRRGSSPIFDFGNGNEKIEIDHLLRNNHVTIELPASLHKEKTRFIDNLTNIPKTNVTRRSGVYWRNRVIGL